MKSVAEIFGSYEQLDSEGRHIGGTDKHGPNHHYGDAYEKIIIETFGKTDFVEVLSEVARNNVHLMMEVGVADGSSLLAWSEIFPNAQIVGMDIHLPGWGSKERYHAKIEFHLGDATCKEDCERAVNGRLFDMIVDDATHHLKDLLRTLVYLWPSIKPGGIYVIEEFENATSLRKNITELWPFARIVGTRGPKIEDEPLVVLTKPANGY